MSRRTVDVADLEIRGQIYEDRAVVKVDIVHVTTGRVIGAGIIPLWCSGTDCEGCGEAHQQGDG